MSLITSNGDLFPSVWNNFFDEEWFGSPSRNRNQGRVPAVNIKELDEKFEVDVAAPGMKKEDFEIDLENNMLCISSEVKQENEEKNAEGNYTRREFNFTSFQRKFSLPESADGEKIKASYTDGVLKISIPKKEEARPKPPRRIEIE